MDRQSIKNGQFQSSIADTYFYLRLGMGVIAVLLPLTLWLGGRFVLSIPPQTSMSAYYHTEMRDVFVGALFAAGFALLLYKGFSRSEDWALNLAGVLAVGVAYFPTKAESILRCHPPCENSCIAYSGILDRTPNALIDSGFHGPCAILFFLAIGYVCAFQSRRTLHLIPTARTRHIYMWVYRVLGVAMAALPLSVAALLKLVSAAGSDCADRTVFWIEAAGVWVFSVFWLLKTLEGYLYGADQEYIDRRAIPDDVAAVI